MNFKPDQLSNFERDKNYIHPAVEHAYTTADEMLAKNAIDPRTFTEYGTENIERDLARVEKKERGFTPEATKVYAEVLEAILYDQIRRGKWFGKKASAIKTSVFDDYVNGSDIILELEEVSRTLSHLSLSVDVTFGTTTEEKKFAMIKKNIDAGTLGEIKYFHSERGGFQGKLSKVPQVVIGVEKELLIKLAGLWADKHGRKTENSETLAAHPVQRLILAEILLQLQTFRIYAETAKKNSLVPIYEKSINILEEILREKGAVSMGDLRNDKVFTAIRESLKMFKLTK
ncbi:MAG: hypothetical protein HZB12_03640 [Candidatus Yonathbacteria bacterium]|nr:hypothetical protein [Candidatus Yonathbacteria bacterium]